MHADVHGAATVVVRNLRNEREVLPPATEGDAAASEALGDTAEGLGFPPSTMQQAADFCVCHSGAWAANVVVPAWWVYAHQVSKTAPSGESRWGMLRPMRVCAH